MFDTYSTIMKIRFVVLIIMNLKKEKMAGFNKQYNLHGSQALWCVGKDPWLLHALQFQQLKPGDEIK